MRSFGAAELREATKKNFRRRLEFEFSDLKYYIMRTYLTTTGFMLFRTTFRHSIWQKQSQSFSQELENKNESLDLEEIHLASLSIREAVRASKADCS